MTSLVPVTDMSVMAESIVKSGFYGFKTKEQVMAVMLVAQAENKHPATVVQEYDIIQGRPALKSQAILARFQLAGGKVKWNEVSRTKCSGTFTHDAGGSITIEWTIDMAKQAGLYKAGSGWEKYPEDMLRARVISRAVRSIYPACILGHYAVEEVMDFDDKPSPRPIKDMGAVEILEDEPVEVIGHELYIPDGEGRKIYSRHNSIGEWIDAYADICSKIYFSTKIKLEEKDDRIHAIRKVNLDFINTWDADDMVKLTGAVVVARNNNLKVE
jgi:hypothetical protein